MANYWASKGHDITLLTLDNGAEPPFYELNQVIKHVPLGIEGISKNLILGVINNIKRILVLRKAIKRNVPQVVISFIDQVNIITLLATLGLNVPVIVSERTNPRYHCIGKQWQTMRRLLYPYASYLVVQTQEALTFFPSAIQRKTRVIPNPIIVPLSNNEFRINNNENKQTKVIMTMGRFSEEKCFDILIKAFAKVAEKHSEWYLVIWGEGQCRCLLESLRDELGLKHRVHLPGRTKEPFEKMIQSDLFVLSSRYEGFPNVLCEAMACGLPVISTDCPSGPSEIIRNGVDGILVPPENVDALAEAMSKLMSNENERKRLASRAIEVTERFNLEKVMGMWEELIMGKIDEYGQKRKKKV